MHCAAAIRGSSRSAALLRKALLGRRGLPGSRRPMVLQKRAARPSSFAIFLVEVQRVGDRQIDRVPIPQRSVGMASDLAGWPLVVTIATGAIAASLIAAQGHSRNAATVPTVTKTICAECPFQPGWPGWVRASQLACCFIPTYFDTRFLLPDWPVLAVAIGSGTQPSARAAPAYSQGLLGVGFAASLLFATAAVAREPLFRPTGRPTGLIDDLVSRYGVANLLNVGNCPAGTCARRA